MDGEWIDGVVHGSAKVLTKEATFTGNFEVFVGDVWDIVIGW